MARHTPLVIREEPAEQARAHHPESHSLLAIALVLAVSTRFSLGHGLTTGLVVAGAFLPVTLSVLARARWLTHFTLLGAATVGMGVLLSLLGPDLGSTLSLSNMISWSLRTTFLIVAVITLVWARTVIGTRAVLQVFAVGSFLTLALSGINTANVWKFSLAVPVTLLILSLTGIFGHRERELSVLLVLTAVSVVNDSRSAAAVLLISAALLLAQGRARTARRRVGLVLIQISAIGVAGFFLVQAAILDGVLGEAARERTEMQIQQSGSVLVGGRPEMGAAVALLREHPWGFGPGSLVSYENLQVAKSGMAALGYHPNNRYVENYMFGSGYEVHSVIGDLWLWFGPLGLMLAVASIVVLVRGMATSLATGAATGALLYLALRALWDMPFSPFGSALVTLPLALAMYWQVSSAPVRAGRSATQRQVGNSRGSLRVRRPVRGSTS